MAVFNIQRTSPPANGAPPKPDAGEIVLITPEIAADWLVHNTHNRNIKKAKVAQYASDMRVGLWRYTGEPIRFDTAGVLIDGQNRLHAIIEAGVPVPMLVIRNLHPDAQRDIDTGSPRKLNDVFKLDGEVNSGALAALVRLVAEWEDGARRTIGSASLSQSRCSQTLAEHPELRDLVNPSRQVGAQCGLPGSILGLAWWLFSNIPDEDAANDVEEFMARLGDGQGLIAGDPIYELRRTLKTAKRGSDRRGRVFLLAITIKAWNAYRRGEPVGLYKWRPGGAKPEPFPEPV